MSENFLEKLADLAGRGFGDLECLVHHPLYFISEYQAKVDDKLIRGSWPSEAMILGLRSAGVDCFVNLCAERGQGIPGVYQKWLSIVDNTRPTLDQARQFIATVAAHKIAYVHCEQGKGRTGCMVAAYRVWVNGWTPAAALKEAEGFGLAFPDQKDWISCLPPK